jgi:PAS domain S-box-containing protein
MTLGIVFLMSIGHMGKNKKETENSNHLDDVPAAIIQCTGRTIYYANKAAAGHFGYRGALPAGLNDFFGEEPAREVRRLLRLKNKSCGIIRRNEKVFDVKINPIPDKSGRKLLYLTDITLIHHSLSSEKEALAIFQTIVENSEDGISIVDDDRFVFVNKKFLQLFGYTNARHLVGKPITTVVDPVDRGRVLTTSRARQLGRDMPFIYEFRGRKRNGESVEIEVAASRIHYNGRPASLSFHRDVTDRIALEKQLIESEEFRENVFSSLEQGVVVFDENLRCLDWNQQMLYFTGFERDEALGMHAREIFRKFREHGALEKFENVLTGTKVSFGYLPYLHPLTKQIRYAWLNLSPLLNAEGIVRGIVCVLSDLTHQKFMQDEIKESETLFRNVLEAMGDALVLTDLQGRVLRVNKEFERITGYAEEEALGQTIPYSWFYEPDTSRFVVWISELREKNFLHDFDIRWKSKLNDIIPVSLNTTLLRNKEGDPIAMLNIARDITDRKKLETELQSRTQQIVLINHVISKANETIEINDLLNTLDRELRQLIEFDRFGIILLRSMDSVEEVAFTLDEGEKNSRREEYTGTSTSLGIDIRKWGKPFTTNNLDRETFDLNNLPLAQKGYKSLVALPIYTKDTFLGILYLATRKKYGFIGNEIDLLQPICEQIGLIVDKLNLFTRVRDDAQYIHNLLYAMDDIVFTVDNNLLITETNTPLNEFPFIDFRKMRGTKKSLISRPLYEVLTRAPYREGIEQVIDALFSENVSVFTTEFIFSVNGEERHYQLRINPMKIEGRIAGLVFTHTDITALKKTEEELKRRNRDLIELNEISAIMTKSLNLGEVYDITLGKIVKMFNASLVTVYLIKDDKAELSGYAGPLTTSEERDVKWLDLDQSVVGTLSRTGKPVRISDSLEKEPGVSKRWLPLIKKYRLQAAVAIPLIVQNKVIGALNLDFNHPRDITNQEMQLLLLIGNQLSAAIENVRLYENLHERMNDLSILASLGNIYASSLDIKEIAESVIGRIKELRNPDVLSISLFDKQEGKLRLVAAEGIPKGRLSHIYDANHPMIQKILKHDDNTIIVDISAEHPELSEVLIRKDQRSVGYFLLKIEGDVLGILSVGFTHHSRFQPQDVALYQSIATQLSMAIQNAQLYQKIQDSEEKYRLLVETAQDMVISMDLDGTFTYVSPSSTHLTGYSPEEILKQKFSPRMIHPGDYRYINKLMRLAADRRVSADPIRALEFRIRTRTGAYRWMSASWTLAHDAQGRVTGVQCILRDVHERRLAEDEITHQLQRLQVLYELAHELAATLDKTYILSAVSKSIKRVLPHQSIAVHLYNEDTPDVLQQILRVNGEGGNELLEEPVLVSLNDTAHELERKVLAERHLCDRRGNWKEPHKIVAPMIMKEKVLGLMVIEVDGTDSYSEIHKNLLQTIAHQAGIAFEKALLYQETVEKSHEIQRRNRELDDFTYVVSHDLKEPLISIEGYSKILLADYQNVLHEDGQELLTSITQSCHRMKNLINELLTLSRVGRLTESMMSVSIDSVLKEILEDLEYTIKKRNVLINFPDNLPLVHGNRVHLVVLFRNLLVNGIKFNTAERPVITIDWKEEDAMYQFSVSDNGIGIDQDYFDQIFVIFHRLRYDSNYEGTGAGLTIVRKIVETHGGKIWLDSMVGKGTTFYFTLPKHN